MKISVRRSGGFAGLTEALVDVDTSSLDPASARKLEQAVLDRGFFERAERGGDDRTGADLYRYEITVGHGGRKHTVGFDDDGSSQAAPLRELLEILLAYRTSQTSPE